MISGKCQMLTEILVVWSQLKANRVANASNLTALQTTKARMTHFNYALASTVKQSQQSDIIVAVNQKDLC